MAKRSSLRKLIRVCFAHSDDDHSSPVLKNMGFSGHINKLEFLVKELATGYQIYHGKNKSPMGYLLKSKPLWANTNSFRLDGKDNNNYVYRELTLSNLVNVVE